MSCGARRIFMKYIIRYESSYVTYYLSHYDLNGINRWKWSLQKEKGKIVNKLNVDIILSDDYIPLIQYKEHIYVDQIR